MKPSAEDVLRMLKDGETETVYYNLTDERKEVLLELADEIIAICVKRTDNAIEVAMVLQFLKDSFEDTVGTRIGRITNVRDLQ